MRDLPQSGAELRDGDQAQFQLLKEAVFVIFIDVVPDIGEAQTGEVFEASRHGDGQEYAAQVEDDIFYVGSDHGEACREWANGVMERDFWSRRGKGEEEGQEARRGGGGVSSGSE